MTTQIQLPVLMAEVGCSQCTCAVRLPAVSGLGAARVFRPRRAQGFLSGGGCLVGAITTMRRGTGQGGLTH
jgi:hypothetical protein